MNIDNKNIIPFTKQTERGYYLPDVSLDDWCNRWNLKPETFECHDCGSTIFVNIPIDYNKETKGLTSKHCEHCDSAILQDIVVFVGDLANDMIDNCIEFNTQKKNKK